MALRWLSLIGLLVLGGIGGGCAAGGTAGRTSIGGDRDEKPKLHVEEVRAEAGSFYPEGTLIETKSYYLNASGEKVLHGPDIQFYENGKKFREVNYRDGMHDGLLVEYSPYSGDKTREEHFRDGRREGLAVEWH